MKTLKALLVSFCFVVLASCGGDGAPVDTTARILASSDVHPEIAKIYADPGIGNRCKAPRVCNGTVRVDCGVEFDGPEIFYEEQTGKVIMQCGGACMLVDNPDPDPTMCKACPPKQWSCPAER